MTEALIGLISAVAVVSIEKIADFISARVSHKEQREDEEEDTIDKTLGEILEEIKELNEEIKQLNHRTDKIERKIEDDNTRNSRIRILRFEDEIRHGVPHSKDHFEEILRDIDTYNIYCRNHPDFQNGIGHDAVDRIREVYADCVRHNNFL